LRVLKFLSKPYRYAALASAVIVLYTAFVLLEAFVIPRAGTPAVEYRPSAEVPQEELLSDSGEPVVTESSYSDANLTITIETFRQYETNIYIADIQISSASLLRAAFADGVYGRNIKETTSEIASEAGAILAVNGDNYGARDEGVVLRNGMLYKDDARSSGQALIVDSEGNFVVSDERKAEVSGAWQVFTFGPALVSGGQLTVDGSTEVPTNPHSGVENPRTAIGQAGPLHYLIIVTDGRTSESAGLTLLELAKLFQERGCATAYNLDGGGSSTLVFMGEVLNRPTAGKKIKERAVSDIVYFGYE